MRRCGLVNCMKCGKEIPDNQVFCDDCLKTMQDYPIKPDAPVQIPKRPATVQEVPITPLDQEAAATAQLRQLRRMVRWLTAIIAILSLLLCGTAFLLLRALDTPVVSNIGKNYTTIGTENNP